MKKSDRNEKVNNISNNKGIKIYTLSFIFAVTGILLLVLVACNLYTITKNYRTLVGKFQLHLNSHEYIDQFQDATDDMTKESRLFVITKDPVHMQRYFEIVDNEVREKACDKLKDALEKAGYQKAVEDFDVSMAESNSLMVSEIHAMKLVVSMQDMEDGIISDVVKNYTLPANEEEYDDLQKRELAYELVLGEEYTKEKDNIDSAIQDSIDAMSEELERDTNLGIESMWKIINRMVILGVMLTVLLAIMFIAMAVFIIRPLRIYIECIRENKMLDIVGAYEFKYLATTYNQIFQINQAHREKMEFELEHDTLTGACSRLAFEEEKKMLSTLQIPIALMVIDVDNFKGINDQYGHEAGDQALIHVVEKMKSLIRNDDIIARIGGDEFVVVLMNTTEANKRSIGRKIDSVNRALQNPEDGEPRLSLSIGIAFSEHGYSEELFKQADEALYKTKNNGRCGYCVYKEW